MNDINSMLTKKEQGIFQQLYSKYNWLGNWRKKLPELKNPHNLNYAIEFVEIDKYLINFVKTNNLGKVWRGYSWFASMERWFMNTKRYNRTVKDLMEPIVPDEEIQAIEEEEEEDSEFSLYNSLRARGGNSEFSYDSLPWADLYSLIKEDLDPLSIENNYNLDKVKVVNCLKEYLAPLSKDEQLEFGKYLITVNDHMLTYYVCEFIKEGSINEDD